MQKQSLALSSMSTSETCLQVCYDVLLRITKGNDENLSGYVQKILGLQNLYLVLHKITHTRKAINASSPEINLKYIQSTLMLQNRPKL